MDIIKKAIITLIIIIFILILFIIMLIEKETINEQPNNKIENAEEIEKDSFKEIDDYETYYKAKAIMNKYITYIRKINGDEKVEIGKLDMTQDEVKATLQKQGIEAIKKVLDKQYIDEMSIDEEKIKLKQNKYKINQETYSLNIENIYEIDLDETITIILVKSKLNNKDLNIIIKLDNLNNTYSIFLDDFIEKNKYSKDLDKKDININIKRIEENSYNSKIKVNTTETNIVSEYFVEYKRKMINDTKTAYELLNEQYKQKKYGSYENFEKYVKNNKEKILNSSIDKYQVTENNGIKNYVCKDKQGKYYIFVEKGITHYEVILDTYTIDLPEFLEKYNKNKNQTKCGMNIQKVFDAINEEDYGYVYDKLDNTFKQNNFSDQLSFEIYAKKYLKNKKIEYKDCEESGEIYIYTITLTDDNEKVETKTIVMKLLDETGFVFSFSK